MTATTTLHTTREAWLHAAIDAVRPMFAAAGAPLPDLIHVSVGFGYGSRAESATILAQCWASCASADGGSHVFISPTLGDPADALSALMHELVHAADDCQSGHRGDFVTIGQKIGLDGKATAMIPGAALRAEMFVLAEELGRYPHSQLETTPATVTVPSPSGGAGSWAPKGRTHTGPARQTNRYFVTRCDAAVGGKVCGYQVRVTRKWLEVGAPICPVHLHPMTPA